MNLLAITPNLILSAVFILTILYIMAVSVLIRNKSGILPYLLFFLLPIIGPLGIILESLMKNNYRK